MYECIGRKRDETKANPFDNFILSSLSEKSVSSSQCLATRKCRALLPLGVGGRADGARS